MKVHEILGEVGRLGSRNTQLYFGTDVDLDPGSFYHFSKEGFHFFQDEVLKCLYFWTSAGVCAPVSALLASKC